MSEWKLHVPTEDNRITHYQCGLVAGQSVRLKKDLVVTTYDGVPTGTVHRSGEEWISSPALQQTQFYGFDNLTVSVALGMMIPRLLMNVSREFETIFRLTARHI